MEAYWHWLCTAAAPDVSFMNCLLKAFGTPEALFRASEGELVRLLKGKGRYEEKGEALLHSRKAWSMEGRKRELEEKGLRFLSCEHPEFPLRLKEISHGPKGIFVRGGLPEDGSPSIAVVGARNCSTYGSSLALQFSSELAEQGVQIISGMARGIDGAAHRGALKSRGKTYAVLGGGADVCYPPENRDIFEEIGNVGGILSESPPGTKPLPHFFPIRNRLISALSDAVLIIEAKERSGSLLTADQALEQGRDVFAVPGRIGDALSAGCNNLIHQGAGIALSPTRLMEDLEIIPKFNMKKGQKSKISLERTENIVYSCLSLQAKNLEEICSLTALSVPEALRILVKLELRGYVREVQKNYYCKNKIE